MVFCAHWIYPDSSLRYVCCLKTRGFLVRYYYSATCTCRISVSANALTSTARLCCSAFLQ